MVKFKVYGMSKYTFVSFVNNFILLMSFINLIELSSFIEEV